MFRTQRNHYKAVFIDWDGTLSNSKFWSHWLNHPLHNQHYQAIQSQLFAKQPQLITDWMRGKLNVEQVIPRLSKIIGLKPSLLLSALATSCQNMTFIEPKLPNLISRLQKTNTTVVIATDNMDTFVRWTTPSLKLRQKTDAILCSHSVGALKSDLNPNGTSKFFNKFLTDARLKPSDCLLIDNSPSSQSLSSVGMDVALVDQAHSASEILSQLISLQSDV